MFIGGGNSRETGSLLLLPFTVKRLYLTRLLRIARLRKFMFILLDSL